MAKKRKKKPRTLPKKRTTSSGRRGTIRMTVLLAVLVGVNLYYFLLRPGTSIPDVIDASAAVPAAGINDGNGPAGIEEDDDIVEGAAIEERDEPPPPGRWARGELQPGDSVIRFLSREGLSAAESEELITAIRPHVDFRKLRAGQGYRLHFDGEGVVDEFELRLSPVLSVVAVRGDTGALTGSQAHTPTELRQEVVVGTIESSMYTTLKDLGEDTRLVALLVDVFAFDLNFYIDQHKGDVFRIVVEKEYLGDKLLRYGRVLAAEWHGVAGRFHAFYFRPDGQKEGDYYRENGESLAKTFLKTPLKYTRVSSKFNPRRMHPVLHRRRGHMGVDYAAPTGTPIWAAASGKITFRGRRGGAGNCVIVKHDNGYTTIYMHLSKFRRGQRVGARVRQKDVIGYVGKTGLATGPHLHFGVKENGKYVDPMKLKMASGAPIADRHRAAFDVALEPLVRLLATPVPR